MKTALALLLLAAILIGLTVLVCVENRPSGYAMPLLVTAAAPRPVWTLTPQCPVTSRNLRRYVERIA